MSSKWALFSYQIAGPFRPWSYLRGFIFDANETYSSFLLIGLIKVNHQALRLILFHPVHEGTKEVISVFVSAYVVPQ